MADLTEWAKTGILEGLPGPFGLGVIQDMADSNRYVVHLGRPGLIGRLPSSGLGLTGFIRYGC